MAVGEGVDVGDCVDAGCEESVTMGPGDEAPGVTALPSGASVTAGSSVHAAAAMDRQRKTATRRLVMRRFRRRWGFAQKAEGQDKRVQAPVES